MGAAILESTWQGSNGYWIAKNSNDASRGNVAHIQTTRIYIIAHSKTIICHRRKFAINIAINLLLILQLS